MRNGLVWVAVIGWMAATGWAQGNREAQPETLVRWHFAGVERLQRLPEQKPLQAVLELPETAALREAALNTFAAQAAARFSRGAGQNQAENAGRIKELLPDLLRYETKFLMTGTAGADADWSLAIRLPTERDADWRARLSELARKAGLQVSDSPKWTATHEKYRLTLERNGQWTLLRGGYSQEEGKAFAEFKRGLDRASGKHVLAAEVDFPRLGELWKAPQLAHAPRFGMTVSPNRDGFRSEMQLEYPRDLGIKPERWVVPTELLREPLVGFTAIQGMREAFAASPIIKALGLQKVPSQLFSWSVGDTPFSFYLSADVGNPREAIGNLAARVIPDLQRSGSLPAGQAQVSSNGNSMIWRGLPVVLPFAQVGAAPASSFLVAGLFPVAAAQANKVPGELFEQLKKKDLIYYEWEITEGRLTQWRPIWQLAYIASSAQIIRGDSPSERWLGAITPKLGNSITEATLDGNRRINVLRQSHLGMNAMELVLLAHWLDPNDLRASNAGAAPAPNAPPARPAPSSAPNAETRR